MSRLVLVTLLGVAAFAARVQALNCLFLTGFGASKKVGSKEIAESSPMWGNIHERLKAKNLCDTIRFYNVETRNNEWNSPQMVQYVCSLMRIWNIQAVFAHGTANLGLALGINRAMADPKSDKNDFSKGLYGGCLRIPHSQTHWYNIQGPMKGAEGAGALYGVCGGRYKQQNPLLLALSCKNKEPSEKNEPIPMVQSVLDLERGWEDYKPGYEIFTAVKLGKEMADIVARTQVEGSLCGAFPDHVGIETDGTGKIKDIGFGAMVAEVQKALHADSADFRKTTKDDINIVPTAGNDGFVGLSSCLVVRPGVKYSRDPSSPFYVMDAEHQAGTCYFGDAKEQEGKTPDEKKRFAAEKNRMAPCTWILNMAERSKKWFDRPGTAPVVTPAVAPAGKPAAGKPGKPHFAQVFGDEEDEAVEQDEAAEEVQDEAEDEAEEADDQEVDAEDEEQAVEEMDF